MFDQKRLYTFKIVHLNAVITLSNNAVIINKMNIRTQSTKSI